jgi:hypothetical protein
MFHINKNRKFILPKNPTYFECPLSAPSSAARRLNCLRRELSAFKKDGGKTFNSYNRAIFLSECRGNPGILDRIIKLYIIFHRESQEEYEQENIAEFLTWLRDVFMPFLDDVKVVMPDVFIQVDNHLDKERMPKLNEIIQNLQDHFCAFPFSVLKGFFLWNLRTKKKFLRFLKDQSPRARDTIRLVLLRLYANPQRRWFFIPQSTFAISGDERFYAESKLNYAIRIKGRLFRREILTISFAELLIKRLTHDENPRVFFTMLMRVLSG